MSPQIEAVLGRQPVEWSADPAAWLDWVHPDDRAAVAAAKERSESTADPVSMEYRMVAKDGRTVWVGDAWSVVPVDGNGRRAFQGLVYDVTARHEADAAVRARNERLRRIIDTQRSVIAGDGDLSSVMSRICAATQELTGAAGATVLLAEGDGFVIRAASGYAGDRVGQTVPMDGTLTGWVSRHNRSTICHDTESDPRGGALALSRGIRSMVLVPLLHEATNGQLQILSREPNSFTEEDLRTLEMLSVVLSTTMSHAAVLEDKRDQVEALARFEAMYEGAAIGIALFSPDERNVECNPAFQEMLGYTSDELRAMTFRAYTHRDDVAHSVQLFAEMMSGERDFYRLEQRFIRKGGDIVWGQVAAALGRDADGAPKYAISMVENITERKLAEERIAYLAYHDSLTGLPNRMLFEEMLGVSLARARRHGLGVGVLFLDLDNFKLVNDSLGHTAGDELLKQLAERLRRCTRDTDLVARQGGDEFLLLLPDLERGTDSFEGADLAVVIAEMVAGRVREALAEPFDLNGTEFYASASMGVSLYPDDAQDATDLLKNADSVMYQVKKVDPGGFAIFASRDDDALRRLSFASRLREAVAAENWVLHYQPIVDLNDGSVRSVEALVRWQDVDGGLLQPGEFISAAEEMGLIEAIGDWVFGELARQQATWRAGGLHVPIGYNLSPRQTWSSSLADRMLGTLAEFDVDPHDITIEITESTAMSDPDRTHRLLNELHSWGFSLAIDDFGTGYSSLARLKQMPVDVVKIDQSFVRNLDRDRDLAGMVRTMIQLTQSLGMVPLAEGIETYNEFEFLRANGCRQAQGFHFAHPVPAEEIPAILTRPGGLLMQPPSYN